MSDQETAAKPAKASGNPAVTWTIRIVVFGALAALLIVALMQWNVKRNFEASQAALNQKEDESKGPLALKDAEAALAGSYETSEMKSKGGSPAKVYTWKGPLSAYRLKISYSKMSDRVTKWTAKQDEIETE